MTHAAPYCSVVKHAERCGCSDLPRDHCSSPEEYLTRFHRFFVPGEDSLGMPHRTTNQRQHVVAA